MSEELEQLQEVAAEPAPAPEPPKPTVTREDWERMHKEKASASGWKDFDEYVAEGGDPLKWKTADAFNIYGELVGTLKKTKQEFDSRVEGLHKLTQAQLEAQRQKLLSERDTAIENADVRQVKAIEQQINQLNTPIIPQETIVLNQWNTENAWIHEDTPRANHAKAVWAKAQQSRIPISEALALVEAEDKRHFGAPSRPAYVPQAERSKGPQGFKGSKSTITMADLTAEEALAYRAMPNAWKSEKEFLQAVADDRKAAGRG